MARPSGYSRPGLWCTDSEHWLVDKVTSGHTLIVGIDDRRMNLKLCGIDKSESQPIGEENYQYLNDLPTQNEYGQVISLKASNGKIR
ncbi:MAG: hypothetical protein AAGE59_33400 [Cyanobacteria bacterium P01_F01_bin.86]